MSQSRRDFLASGLAAAGVLGLAGLASDGSRPRSGFLGLMERVNERLERLLFDPRRLAPELPESEQTPLASFPRYKIGVDFPSAPLGWALAVGGLVRRPLRLSLGELQRLPRTHMRVRHHCVEGWTAVASWEGVRLSDIGRLADVDPAARYVEFRSFEPGYWSSWDLASAFHPQTILAYGMDGAPLAREHGAPLRLYSAVKLGYKMVKYVLTVNFLPQRSGGYWEDQGYEWYAGV